MADLVIIDDDPDNLDVLAGIMVSAGHQVQVGYDGEAGLRLLHERRPDLVLLDVEMPILDGPGMAAAMFLHNLGMEKIPVILLSGVVGLREVAARVGTPYFLSKPYRFNQIMAIVERALTERIAPRPAVIPSKSAAKPR